MYPKGSIPIVVLLLASWLAVGSASVQAQRYVLSPLSQLWLAGTSTLSSFECEAGTLRFDHEVDHEIEGRGFTLPGVSMIVPIRDLDCDNRRMNRDLREALQADTFPEIRLDVFQIDMPWDTSASIVKDSRPRVVLHGRMTLAGASRDMEIQLSGWLDDGQRLHGRGSLEVRMTDFGIDPPTALLGLVKAHDDILIHFHLMADPDRRTSDVPAGGP